MKKRIAFFGYNLEIGGAEKSLVNLINYLNKDFNIDLYLYEKKGELLDNIPDNVNIYQIKKNRIQYLLFKYVKRYRIKYINKLCSYNYDYLAAYLEGRLATLITETKVNCPKYAWIHTDVDKHSIGISDKEAINSYQKVDKIIFVSANSKDKFFEKFACINTNKAIVMPNLLNITDIKNKSLEKNVERNRFTFVAVSKLRPEKRHDLLLQACQLLKSQNYDFELWIIGDGILKEQIKEQINSLGLKSVVKLFGLQINPYPYIKCADSFIITSDYEGQGLSVVEALILNKPVISTDILPIKKALNNKYGIICKHSAVDIAEAMIKMLNPDCYKKIEKNLVNYELNFDFLYEEIKELFK